MFDFDETSSDLCSALSLQDAFDAVGYFQLALAAALEDQANPEALYVVYMKLAEIHGNHMPDAQLCQVYRDRAQSLKRVLAGLEGAAVGQEDKDDADSEAVQNMERNLDADVGYTENLVKSSSSFYSIPEGATNEDDLAPRTRRMHVKSDDRCTDANRRLAANGKTHHNYLPDSVDVSGSETDTIASQSYSESILTESFDTAKEDMSDSSSSTDTLQTQLKPPEHNIPTQKPVNCTSDITGHAQTKDADSDTQDDKNTLTNETPAQTEPGTDQKEIVVINNDEALREDKEGNGCETGDAHSEHADGGT